MTELRTGLDLVREQLRVAAGLPLSVAQDDVNFRGHAIEVRVSAEDPNNRFLPASGTIAALHDPAGPGVRLDSGIYEGMPVPLYYDPLLAKLICWGQDRAEALARLRRALEEYVISGVRTTIPFAQWLLHHPRFVAGDFSTDFIAEEWHPEAEGTADGVRPTENGALDDEELAALVAVLALQDQGESARRLRHTGAENGASDGSRWRTLGRRGAVSGW